MNTLLNLRKKSGATQKELADYLGISRQAYANYENGNREPDFQTLLKLARYFKVSVDYLLGNDTPENKKSGLRIPVLGYVAAGIPIEAIEDIIDYEELSPDIVKDGAEYFALQIQGASMEPKISDGDVVIVRKQPDVDSGQIAIVCVNGDHATCKKVMKQQSGILLQPLNPAYEATFYSTEDIENIPITILGRVVELRAKF